MKGTLRDLSDKTPNRIAGDGSLSGLIFDIKRYAVHDGPGIRLTLFFKGCPLDCWWCHNPEGKVPEIEKVTDHTGRNSGEPGRIGEIRTVDEIMEEISREVLFFDESGGGVTFSGGEPLMQPEFLSALAERCRSQGIHTTLDTCGFAEEEIFNPISRQMDLFLYDLKFIDPELHRKFTGVDSRLILNNLMILDRMKRPVIIRFPVIPGITGIGSNVEEVADFLRGLKNVSAVDLLPFHRLAAGKYDRLRIRDRMKDILPPEHLNSSVTAGDSEEEILRETRTVFESRGFTVKTGG